jgi:hypothetical protein
MFIEVARLTAVRTQRWVAIGDCQSWMYTVGPREVPW